jgi:hypothetical protein
LRDRHYRFVLYTFGCFQHLTQLLNVTFFLEFVFLHFKGVLHQTKVGRFGKDDFLSFIRFVFRIRRQKVFRLALSLLQLFFHFEQQVGHVLLMSWACFEGHRLILHEEVLAHLGIFWFAFHFGSYLLEPLDFIVRTSAVLSLVSFFVCL